MAYYPKNRLQCSKFFEIWLSLSFKMANLKRRSRKLFKKNGKSKIPVHEPTNTSNHYQMSGFYKGNFYS